MIRFFLAALALLALVPVASAQTTNVLETALDPYVPLLIWGGIATACMIFNAWLPAVVAMMNWAAGATGFWGINASTMFLLIALTLHTIVVQGIIPTPWRRNT